MALDLHAFQLTVGRGLHRTQRLEAACRLSGTPGDIRVCGFAAVAGRPGRGLATRNVRTAFAGLRPTRPAPL